MERDLLLAGRARARERVAALEREFAALAEAASAAGTDDEHDPEGATLAFERQHAAALLEAAREQVAALDDALRRLAEGRYGVCDRCGQPIGAEQTGGPPRRRHLRALRGRRPPAGLGDEGGEEFGPGRAWGGVPRRRRADRDHLVQHARLGQHVGRRGGQRRHRGVGAQHVRVARRRRVQGLAEVPGRVAGVVGLAGDLGVDLGQPVPVEFERGPVKGADRGLGDLVEPAGQPLRLVRADLAEQVPQRAGVQQPDGGAPAERGVGAGPCVAEGDQAGDDGLAVDQRACGAGPRWRRSPARR